MFLDYCLANQSIEPYICPVQGPPHILARYEMAHFSKCTNNFQFLFLQNKGFGVVNVYIQWSFAKKTFIACQLVAALVIACDFKIYNISFLGNHPSFLLNLYTTNQDQVNTNGFNLDYNQVPCTSGGGVD